MLKIFIRFKINYERGEVNDDTQNFRPSPQKLSNMIK